MAGLAALARRRQGLLVLLFLTPLGLNFAAAAVHRFPYGGHPRMGLCLGSVFSMLVGLGVAELLAWAAARRSATSPAGAIRCTALAPGAVVAQQHRTLGILLAAMLALAAGIVLRDLAHPYHTQAMLRSRAFARWFWLDVGHDCELVCLQNPDFAGESLGRVSQGRLDVAVLVQPADLLPAPSSGTEPDRDRVSAEWPLRCVWFRSPASDGPVPGGVAPPRCQAATCWWPATSMPCRPTTRPSARRQTVDYLDVFKFVPRQGTSLGPTPPQVRDIFRAAAAIRP